MNEEGKELRGKKKKEDSKMSGDRSLVLCFRDGSIVCLFSVGEGGGGRWRTKRNSGTAFGGVRVGFSMKDETNGVSHFHGNNHHVCSSSRARVMRDGTQCYLAARAEESPQAEAVPCSLAGEGAFSPYPITYLTDPGTREECGGFRQ